MFCVAKHAAGLLRERAQGSSPKSEAWLEAEHARAISYAYWVAWLNHYAAVGDRSVDDEVEGGNLK